MKFYKALVLAVCAVCTVTAIPQKLRRRSNDLSRFKANLKATAVPADFDSTQTTVAAMGTEMFNKLKPRMDTAIVEVYKALTGETAAPAGFPRTVTFVAAADATATNTAYDTEMGLSGGCGGCLAFATPSDSAAPGNGKVTIDASHAAWGSAAAINKLKLASTIIHEYVHASAGVSADKSAKGLQQEDAQFGVGGSNCMVDEAMTDIIGLMIAKNLGFTTYQTGYGIKEKNSVGIATDKAKPWLGLLIMHPALNGGIRRDIAKKYWNNAHALTISPDQKVDDSSQCILVKNANGDSCESWSMNKDKHKAAIIARMAEYSDCSALTGDADIQGYSINNIATVEGKLVTDWAA